MEAVPRLPMISFDLKVSPDRPPTDFSKLKQYIRDFYNEDPETYSAEIRNVESLRAQAVHPVKDVNGCAILKKYYCQLHFMESRFPMSKDGPASIAFTWRDTYSGMIGTVMDIKYEIVAILYNIGALHSQIGASDDRTTPEGLKMSCTHFQCAAWAFQHIKDSYAQPSGMDLSPDLMQFMYQLCLAQAQECILEKSMTDNRKATINARVATQIVDYYNLAQNALIQGGNEDGALVDVVGSKLMKSWKRYVRFKATYYTCVSLLYQGMQSEEQQKMGERVAYFQAALDKLNEAIKSSKGLDQFEAVSESLMFTRDVVECKRKAAKSENEFIYHEEVVDVDSLPTIKGASLVKGISFNINDVDISGADIFARLVPMKAHEASSLYSEEKAKLLRKINGLIDAKDEEVVSFMSCLQLDNLKAHLEPNSLPQEVVDRCAALSVKPDAIPNLIAAMDKLNDAYHDVDAMLLEIMELIKVEEKNEKEYQEIMGSRAPSIVATDLTREANKYMEAHKKAADSNETLNRAMSQHVENLRVLQQSLPELQAQLPTLAPLKLDDSESLKEVTMLVGKVDEMRKQRAMLASQLRESICSDDITTILVTRSSDSLETIFEEELRKHERYVKLIEQNLSAQENILKALTDAYARYAPTRKATSEIIKQRELMLSALVSSYDAYEDLIAKSSKGMEFYRKLETNLTKLLQRVKGTCKVQQEEREAILAKNNIKIGHEPVVVPEVSSAGPKLKDYLQKRKEAQAFGGGGYPVGYPVDQSQNWLPGVRPAPVGSEVTQPVVSSTKPHEYSAQANAYPGANMAPYQQSYSHYQTPYGQNVSVPYQPPLNNLQYPSMSDHSLSVDSTPTAPYRPDSRASTSSDHSISQQNLTAHTPAAPVAPSQDPRISPVHGADNRSAKTNQVATSVNQDQVHPPVSGQNFGQNPYGNYAQVYPYQGYSYPTNYNPYGTQTTGNINPHVASSPYSSQHPNMPSANTYPPQQASGASTQVSVAYSTQPSNVSIIQVNSGGGTQQQNVPPRNQNVPNSQVPGNYSTAASVVTVNTALSTPLSGVSQTTKTINYYDPSHAKAMSVPSASYNGPYGSNTITSPYANYYTSQVYNGNVSSTATDKANYDQPASSSPTVSQTNSSVYTPPNSSQPSYVPIHNNQVPTTTYTVPASQQFSTSNQTGKTNYPSSTQPYTVPSLVSPTQTTFNLENTGQTQFSSGQATPNQTPVQNLYPGGAAAQSSVSHPVVSGNPDPSYSSVNTTNVSAAAQYPYAQTQMYNAEQYSNYYYSRGQAVPGYPAQTGQMQYNNYSASYGHQATYSSGQANASNPYSSNTHPYSNYANQPTGYLPSSNQVAVTSTSTSQGVNYSQNQVANYAQQPMQQAHPTVTSPQVQPSQISYPQNVANYSQTNQASLQHYQSTPQQHVQPANYMQTAQPSAYMASHQTGMVYSQQPYNSGQAMPGAYVGYTSTNQTPMNMNTGYAAPNQTSVNPANQVSQVAASQPTESKSSNIDLLAGLDFTVSDTPLQPLPQPTPVSQISDSLSSLNLETPPSTEVPPSTMNGEIKPQVEFSTNEIKQEDKTPPNSASSTKTDEPGSKLSRDPFTDVEALNQFVQEVDKFEKFVEGLCEKTLSGPTPLDIKWNELQDLQEKDGHKQNISVARCYPMKNRFPDILPYDNSTVELPSTKDDYINASFVKNICGGCPDFILTQAPLSSTYADFWTMILEQHIELVVCLLSDSQMNGEIYWPQSKTDDLIFGELKVSLQSCNPKSFWLERIISVSNNKSSRVVVHLQFTAWPNSWFPESPGPWLQLVGESLSVWRGCRNTDSCIVVHCDAGVGRSGLFVVTAAALSEMLLSPHIPEMVPIAATLAKWRKNPLRDRDHLKFAYQILLYYCQDILMKRGILSSKGTFEEKRSKGKSHTRHPSQDFLLNSSTHSASSEERRHSDASSTGSRMSEIDPLNQLDPLWQIKRLS